MEQQESPVTTAEPLTSSSPDQKIALPTSEMREEREAVNGMVPEASVNGSVGGPAVGNLDEKKLDTESVDLLGVPPQQQGPTPGENEVVDLLSFSPDQKPKENLTTNAANAAPPAPELQAEVPATEASLLDVTQDTEISKKSVDTRVTTMETVSSSNNNVNEPVQTDAPPPQPTSAPTDTLVESPDLGKVNSETTDDLQQNTDSISLTEPQAVTTPPAVAHEATPATENSQGEVQKMVTPDNLPQVEAETTNLLDLPIPPAETPVEPEEVEETEMLKTEEPITLEESAHEPTPPAASPEGTVAREEAGSKTTESLECDTGDTSTSKENNEEAPVEEALNKGEQPTPTEAGSTDPDTAPRERVVDGSTADLIAQLQASLDDQMLQRKQAEQREQQAEDRVRQCEEQLTAMSGLKEEVERLNENIVELVSEKSNMEFEMNSLEQSRDEHERKANVLSNRLNAAKKKEGIKANIAEQLEDEIKEIQNQLSTTQNELAEMTAEKEGLELEMEVLKKKCVDRVKAAETSLEEEQRLNEERKKKMKLYIEAKAEELRVAKAHNDELQVEVEQTQISLRETNDRWKQLHAQWVQSQTRNRELQRDLNRIKKDSDHLHKIGDNLELKLSRSAQETEEHKNKRLTAKHELMTILRTLEAERSVSSKLRDSIKFTFTPKALSQQQLLKESLQDFESELIKLSRRVGKPLPPAPMDSPHFHGNGDNAVSSPSVAETDVDAGSTENDVANSDETGSSAASKKNKSEIDSTHLLSNLEDETQRVSQCIMALISNIERMSVLLQEGDRTCMTALTDLLTGTAAQHSSQQDETTSITGGGTARNRLGMSPYASVPNS